MAILLFGGTKEGRMLAELLASQNKKVHICVATEYGASLLEENDYLVIHKGRMDEDAMISLIQREGILECLDATHPYAVAVTDNIKKACDKCKIAYTRILREDEKLDAVENCTFVDSIDAAVDYLSDKTGKVFITTGSKELHKYVRLKDYKERCFARVLSTPEVLMTCREIGFEGKNICCMQGPFSEELNYAMLKQTGAEYMVTKSSGEAGGFMEKCEAAIRAGVHIVIVGRPSDSQDDHCTVSYSEYVKKCAGDCQNEMDTLYLIGIGCGGAGQFTIEAAEALKKSDCVIGATRVLAACEPFLKNECVKFCSYKPEEIVQYLKNPFNIQVSDINASNRKGTDFKTVSLVFSGDIGFYSGAKKTEQIVTQQIDIKNVCRIPGISSVSYFCSKIGVSWEEVYFVSNHGIEMDILKLIKTYPKVCSLLGKATDVSDMCSQLNAHGLENVKVTVGERLSYPEEKITAFRAKEIDGREFDSLAVVLFET